MRCEHCNQNEATTYIKQNINGKVTEMHLCRDCAEKLGVLEPMHSNMGLGSMFEGSFFGNFLGGRAGSHERPDWRGSLRLLRLHL